MKTYNIEIQKVKSMSNGHGLINVRIDAIVAPQSRAQDSDDAGEPLHAEARAATLYGAVDASAGELVEELNKAKTKRKDEARHDAVKGKEMLREGDEI